MRADQVKMRVYYSYFTDNKKYREHVDIIARIGFNGLSKKITSTSENCNLNVAKFMINAYEIILHSAIIKDTRYYVDKMDPALEHEHLSYCNSIN